MDTEPNVRHRPVEAFTQNVVSKSLDEKLKHDAPEEPRRASLACWCLEGARLVDIASQFLADDVDFARQMEYIEKLLEELDATVMKSLPAKDKNPNG